MPDQKNPQNLPVIEETSLHRIAKRVKKWQLITPKPPLTEYSCSSEIDEGLFDSEEYYEYKDKDFNLIYDKKLKKFLPIGEYLRVYLDNKNENIVKIESIKPFYWKEWNFEEDIERIDWSKIVVEEFWRVGNSKYRKNINTKGFIKNPDKNAKTEFYVEYDFRITLSNIFIGNISSGDHTDDVEVITNNTTVSIYFKENIIFNSVSFLGSLLLRNTIFEKDIQFKGSNFSEQVNFSDCELLIQNNPAIGFYSCIFEKKFEFESVSSKKIDFNHVTFLDEVKLVRCNFEDMQSCFSAFQKKVNLLNSAILNISLSSNNYESIVRLEDLKSSNVNLSETSFPQKLYFSLADDSKENYQNLTLNLYHASFGDFVCDDRNLAKVKLLCSENLNERQECIRKEIPFEGRNEYENLKEKDVIEQAIAERRVFRKILQDLHWGDKADEEYARIMDLQLKLDFLENDKAARLKQFFFGWWLGWGVRILTWKFWKGGIIWSSVLILVIFYFMLKIDFSSYFVVQHIKQFLGFIPNKRDFLKIFFNVNVSPNYGEIKQIIISIFSFFQLNLFLVILARKFMRM